MLSQILKDWDVALKRCIDVTIKFIFSSKKVKPIVDGGIVGLSLCEFRDPLVYVGLCCIRIRLLMESVRDAFKAAFAGQRLARIPQALLVV